ncbi:MAG: hypothetical protein ACXWKD_02285 [Caldimonas sp.]
MLIAVAVAGSTAAHEWWKSTRQPEPPAATQPRQSFELGRARVETFVARPEPASPPPVEDFPSPGTRAVTKCVVNGRVSYSGSADCPTGGATISIKPAQSEMEGGFTPYQLQMLRSADARIARDEWAATANMSTQSSAISSKNAQCSGLDQAIQSLDARARSPISGHEQDLIRIERTKLTSRQFALRC